MIGIKAVAYIDVSCYAPVIARSPDVRRDAGYREARRGNPVIAVPIHQNASREGFRAKSAKNSKERNTAILSLCALGVKFYLFSARSFTQRRKAAKKQMVNQD